MVYKRSSCEAYQRWADEVGDSNYTFEALSPYFEKSTTFTAPDISKRGVNATPQYDLSTLGTRGPVDITFSNYAQPVSTWVQKGMAAVGILPINGFTSGQLIGSSWPIGTINHTYGTRESSETAYLEPALSLPNLIVYPSTLAKKILFDKTTASGVVVSTGGYQYTLTARKEVIVSGGTFQSPQLLMVSGVGPRATLEQHNIPVVANLPGVGQNMWDHILFGPSYRVKVQTASALGMGDNFFVANAKFVEEQTGPLASPGGDFLGT
jgi:choline dehydrogenase